VSNMEKYKICPGCGHHNNPLLLECAECEADLQNVPVVDDTLNAGTGVSGAAAKAAQMVRICDCGVKNPANARRCSACGEDISMNLPVPEEENTKIGYVLASLDGSYAYEIQEGITAIGRTGQMGEYLKNHIYVSRVHAQLKLDPEAGELAIRSHGATNFTFVNNTMIEEDTWVALKDGDEVVLGGNGTDGTRQSDAAYFLVRIGGCI